MTEEMSREKAEWSPQWLTIREFSHITPVNLFHKEQEEGEKQPGAEQQLAEEFWKNLHVLVRARFTLETAQENLTLRLTAPFSSSSFEIMAKLRFSISCGLTYSMFSI